MVLQAADSKRQTQPSVVVVVRFFHVVQFTQQVDLQPAQQAQRTAEEETHVQNVNDGCTAGA
jgi:hypothetical protein